MKTSELIGPALDYSVAKCEAVTLAEHIDGNCSWLEHEVSGNWVTYSPLNRLVTRRPAHLPRNYESFS